jgi:hypothetical protein
MLIFFHPHLYPPPSMGRKFKGILLTLFISPLPLRERVRVRGDVNFFHPHLYPPPSMWRKFLKNFAIPNPPLPLREKVRVRVEVKQSLSSLHQH